LEKYYLIDFENVSTGGFSGCELLGNDDHIHVFFTDKSTKFDLNILHRHKAATLEIHKVPCGNQSADMHIVSYLGYLVGKNTGKDFECIIVSKDTDFDNVIKFWTEAEGVSVRRSPVIKSDNADGKKKNKKETQDKKVKKNNVSSPAGKNRTERTVNDQDTEQQKKELAERLRKAIGESEISPCFTDEITNIVTSHIEEKHMLTSVHNDLRQIFTDYSDVYDLVRKVVKEHGTGTASKDNDRNRRNSLSLTVKKDLNKAKIGNEDVDYLASVAVKYSGKTDSKALANKALVKKYGQDMGNDLYKKIKKYL
jgi:hypothetical protein